MEAKSNVVKSKSSNSAITNRSAEHREKKCKSNAEFQKNVLKKRGVYVEKKAQANETEAKAILDQPVKAPPRPRPGRKMFLASVLNILAKTTTGTQCPDSNDPKDLKKDRTKRTVRRRLETGNDATSKDNNVKKKYKYRSRVLNRDINRDVKDEKLVVLQPLKDITQTSSVYSENETFNNCFNLPLVLKKGLNDVNNVSVDENKISFVDNSLLKEVMEGKQMKKEKRVRIEDPVTLVGDAIDKTVKGAVSDNKGLYNFFVDLLETTISVNNVKAEYEKERDPNEGSSTKIPFEIDESVVKKLKIETIEGDKEVRPRSSSPSNKFFYLKDDRGMRMSRYSPSPTVIAEPAKPPSRKRQMKAQSIAIIRKTQAANRMNTESAILDKKKSSTRKQRKQTLINLFKEQLRMKDDDCYEEPQNLYEALKVIANNKRRCQKTLHFEDRMGRNRKDYGFPECMFKRPKIISSGKKKKGNKSASASFDDSAPEIKSFDRKSNRCLHHGENQEYGSEHSLQVYGFDYEHPSVRKQPTSRGKEIVFTYHSSSSSEQEFCSKDELLDYTDSVFNEFCKSPSIKSCLK